MDHAKTAAIELQSEFFYNVKPRYKKLLEVTTEEEAARIV